jgi:hypothetical protein
LQTEEYAKVLTADSVEPIAIGPAVKIRLQRQRQLAQREEQPWQTFIMDEAVIRRHVGVRKDPAIMLNQLRHIVDAVQPNDRATVRVIPFGAGEHRGLYGPFVLLEFEGHVPDVLYLEGGRTASVMIAGDDPQIAEHRDSFELLLEQALSADDSLDLIRNAAEEMS